MLVNSECIVWCVHVFSGEPQISGHPYSAVNGSTSFVEGLMSMEQPARVKQQMFVHYYLN